MSVAKQCKLLKIVCLFQAEYKCDKAKSVQRERYEPVVGYERHKKIITTQQKTKLFDQTLAIQKII